MIFQFSSQIGKENSLKLPKMLFCCFSHSSGASGEDVLLLLHPTAWPSGFSASMWVTWVEPPIHSSAALEEGLLSSPHYLFGRRLLLFPWVISPPRRRENQVSSHHGKRCVPPSRRLSYYTLALECFAWSETEQPGELSAGGHQTHSSWDVPLGAEELLQIPNMESPFPK